MRKYTWLFISLFLLLLGCNSNNSENVVGPILFDLDSDQLDSSKLDIKKLPLQTEEDFLLGQIGKVELYNDKIFILETSPSQEYFMFVFDTAGRFINRFGRKGRGPQEVIAPTSFSIDNNRVGVVSPNLNRINYYSADNYEFMYSRPLPFTAREFVCTSDGDMVWSNRVYNVSDDILQNCYLLTDSIDLNPKKGFIKRINSSGYQTGPISQMFRFNDEVRVFDSYNPIIYTIKDGTISPVYTLIFDKFQLPSEDFINKHNQSPAFFTELQQSEYVSYFTFNETKDNIFSVFIVQDVVYCGLFDKNSEEGYAMSREKFKNKTGISLEGHISTIGDYFVVAVNENDKENPVLYMFKTK